MYVDNNDKLHAIVKEEPYKQYNPINITVRVQKCPIPPASAREFDLLQVLPYSYAV